MASPSKDAREKRCKKGKVHRNLSKAFGLLLVCAEFHSKEQSVLYSVYAPHIAILTF